MQIVLEKISRPRNQSFFLKEVKKPYFTAPLHFHPEIEILFVQQGHGTRYVGDSIANFQPGDLVLIGSNTPHLWLCDQEYYEKDTSLISHAICVQFRQDFLGQEFIDIPEAVKIKQLLSWSRRGIKFTGQTREILKQHLTDLVKQEGLARTINLLIILDIMASSQEMIYLSSPGYEQIRISEEDTGRLERVFNFVSQNFEKDITLKDVASLVSLTPESFCRYFKSRTNKVFSDFLNEVRIGNACKMLMNGKHTISESCFASGFNHLSNFNRQFKRIKGMTPSEFQKKYWDRTTG